MRLFKMLYFKNIIKNFCGYPLLLHIYFEVKDGAFLTIVCEMRICSSSNKKVENEW